MFKYWIFINIYEFLKLNIGRDSFDILDKLFNYDLIGNHLKKG